MKLYEAIEIYKESEEALYIQIYNQIKKLIENGTLKNGEKLPGIRRLSKDLNVNNVTVVNAYKMLENNSLAYSKVGSGTFIGLQNIREKEHKREYSIESNIDKEDIVRDEINFSSLTPDPKFFPVNEFKEVLNEVLDRDGGDAFSYQKSKGYYPLREAIREYTLSRSVEADIEDIHIISGAQQGIDIASKALINFGDTIVVESPTYMGALAAFRSRGARIIEVPMERDGIDVVELEKALKNHSPKLIYLMTNFQNPTGVSYSSEKKKAILKMAEKYNTYILEDDYLPELTFDNDDRYPLKSIDYVDRVIYLKSFSKIFMPGIRLGYLVTPKRVASNIMAAKHTSDISTSSLMQRAVDLYLRRKKWEPHIENMKNIYKKRYDASINALNSASPYIKFTAPGGGIHIYCETDIDSLMLSSVAKKRGVSIVPGSVFYLDNRSDNKFRISFACATEDEIQRGIEIIKECYLDLKNLNSGNLFQLI